jgi:hypothetical protein
MNCKYSVINHYIAGMCFVIFRHLNCSMSFDFPDFAKFWR